MKIVTAHQIEHLGWLGLLDKFSKADYIVLCDSMQFKKEYFENRNKIRIITGWQWLLVPVKDDTHKPMKEIEVIDNNFWRKKYLKSICYNYKKSPYFDKYYPDLEKIINKPENYLIDLNTKLMYQMWKWFGINKEFCFLSQLKVDSNLKSTDLAVEMAKKTNADIFLAGPSGKDYLIPDASWASISEVGNDIPRNICMDAGMLAGIMVQSRIVDHGLKEQELEDIYLHHCLKIMLNVGRAHQTNDEETVKILHYYVKRITFNLFK